MANEPAADAHADDAPSLLKRDLGASIAVAVVVGNVIGSGIFYKPGKIAADAGSFGLILALWLVGGVLCLLGGLCFAELAAMFPRAGGMYVYLREAYGRMIAFLFGWMEVVFGKPAAIGALAVVFVGSLSLNLNALLSRSERAAISPAGELVLTILVILGLAWVNIVGVIWGGRVQLLTTIVKAGFLAAVAMLPFALLPWRPNAIEAANFASTLATPSELPLAERIGAVLLAVMWAYNGWHGVTPLAEEIRHPQRNLPLALLAGIGILIVLYVGANVAYHGVLSMQEMKDAGDHAAEVMLARLLGPLGGAAMSAVIMCSTFGAINSNLLQAPRVSFAMGRDGVFFSSLGRVHATFRTPTPAIVLLALMAVLLVAAASGGKQLVQALPPGEFSWPLVSRVVGSLQNDSIFTLLTNFVIFSASIFYMLTVLAVIVLRRRRPGAERPYLTWGYPLTPVAFLIVYVWFLSQVYRSQPLEAHTGLVFIAAGVPVYFAFRRWRRRSWHSPEPSA